MTHLYVTDNGATIGVEGGRFVITQKKNLVRSIPKESVESISVFGNSTITTPCVQDLLQRNIPVCYFSSKGRYYGRLQSTSNQHIDLLKQQINCFEDEEFYLYLAQKVIMAKIHNQLVVLQRYLKDGSEFENEVTKIKQMRAKTATAESIPELMGYEGMAAKIYFNVMGQIVLPEFRFYSRNRRPPKDPFNSLLSLGYTLLMYEIMAKIESVDLNPFCGFIHQDRNGSPALCSDMMEEWRATMVDATVLSMVQGKEICYDDFVSDDDANGIYLTNEALRKFINKFERKLNGMNKYLKYDQKEYSFRQAMHVQSKKLVECINLKNPEIYKPILLR